LDLGLRTAVKRRHLNHQTVRSSIIKRNHQSSNGSKPYSQTAPPESSNGAALRSVTYLGFRLWFRLGLRMVLGFRLWFRLGLRMVLGFRLWFRLGLRMVRPSAPPSAEMQGYRVWGLRVLWFLGATLNLGRRLLVTYEQLEREIQST
jgi:hypothetical protein